MDPAVAVTPPVLEEDALDRLANLAVSELCRGRPGRMVVRAARQAQGRADAPDGRPRAVSDGDDHFPDLGLGLVPRITAAFFKMSFSSWRSATWRLP